jgi:hypothetical protein
MNQESPRGARDRSVTLLPPERFHCQLDEQPGFLVPPRLLPAPPDSAAMRRLIVNPRSWFSRHGPPPAEVLAHGSLLESFCWSDESVVVADDVMGALLPYSFGSAYRALTKGLACGETPPRGLPVRVVEVLAAARVLIAPDDEQVRRAEWTRALGLCSEMFRRGGYAPVAGLLHPFHIGAMRRYYRYLIRSGRLKLGDRQSQKRFAAHNETAASFFHHQLTATMSVIAGEPVKPSYVYLASYQSGAELPRHTDRPQCEFSVTMLVDCSPEPELESPWPIHLETPRGEVIVYQALGDGLAYRGRTLPHLRRVLPDGCTSTSLFFHYVRESFNGPLY